MSKSLTNKIHQFIEDRYVAKREVLDKEYKKAQEKAVSNEDIDKIDTQFNAKREKLLQDFEIKNWLDSAAERASQISMATHAIKFTHSAAKGTNVLLAELGHDNRYLDTPPLQNLVIDAVGNAAALDVARILQLKDDSGLSLLDYLKQDNPAPLESLTQNSTQLDEWINGLKQALLDTTPSSHTLSKQIYFPINENEYHLLAPLYSSSLSQLLYEEINHSRFSQDMVAARKARKEQLPHEQAVVAYPNLAVTIAGGSKPQNISQLNSGRGGRNYLFSTCPPKWQSQLKAPSFSNNIFTHSKLNYVTRRSIQSLASFLTKLNQQQVDSNLRIRNHVKKLIDSVIDQIFDQVGQWQQLPIGWSDEAPQLPIAQCRWLDPQNPKWSIEDEDWPQEIAHSFGLWLKDKVNHYAKGDFTLGAIEAAEWQGTFKQALREIN